MTKQPGQKTSSKERVKVISDDENHDTTKRVEQEEAPSTDSLGN